MWKNIFIPHIIFLWSITITANHHQKLHIRCKINSKGSLHQPRIFTFSCYSHLTVRNVRNFSIFMYDKKSLLIAVRYFFFLSTFVRWEWKRWQRKLDHGKFCSIFFMFVSTNNPLKIDFVFFFLWLLAGIQKKIYKNSKFYIQ